MVKERALAPVAVLLITLGGVLLPPATAHAPVHPSQEDAPAAG